jgi:hypothetical protein
MLWQSLVVRRDWNFVANATGTKCQLRPLNSSFAFCGFLSFGRHSPTNTQSDRWGLQSLFKILRKPRNDGLKQDRRTDLKGNSGPSSNYRAVTRTYTFSLGCGSVPL